MIFFFTFRKKNQFFVFSKNITLLTFTLKTLFLEFPFLSVNQKFNLFFKRLFLTFKVLFSQRLNFFFYYYHFFPFSYIRSILNSLSLISYFLLYSCRNIIISYFVCHFKICIKRQVLLVSIIKHFGKNFKKRLVE